MRLIPLREITMMQLMNQLTEKQDWDQKVSAILLNLLLWQLQKPDNRSVTMRSSQSGGRNYFPVKGAVEKLRLATTPLMMVTIIS